MVLTKFVSRLSLAGARVDRENGIIKGVSICSVGDVKGHDKVCDETTLKQLRDCAKEYEGGLRIRFNPNTFGHTEGTLVGFIPNESFRISKGRLTGDMSVYKNAPHIEYLYELAERTPDLFGMSVEFSGVDEEKDKKTFARCSEILAAQIVDLPAANPTGLFSEGSREKDKEEMTMDEKTITQLATTVATATAKAVTDSLKPVFETFKAGQAEIVPPTKEELELAGVTDKDDDATKATKVKAFRATADKPVTVRDLMQMFRQTGSTTAARTSGAGEGARKNADEEGFEKLIEKEIEGGAKNRGRAIMLARKRDPKLYNAWMAKRNNSNKSGEATEE